MPKTTAKVSNRPMWLGSKNGFAKHHLVGANTVMLTLLSGSVALNWSSTDASSCTASDNWSGSRATSGSETIDRLNESATFTIRCSGDGGSASDTVSYQARGRRWLDLR